MLGTVDRLRRLRTCDEQPDRAQPLRRWAEAGFCAYGGASGDDGSKPYGHLSSAIRFIDNVFQRGSSGVCGYWGPVTDFDPSRPGNVWTGNRYTDGVMIPIPN